MSLVRVFEIPMPDGQFCFGGGRPKQFIELDWFRDEMYFGPDDTTEQMETAEGRQRIANFLLTKNYYRPDRPLLVMSSKASFTMNYDAP